MEQGAVVGVASVFFSPDLIFGPVGLFPGGEPDDKGFKSPPLGACYLSNMAVDPTFQRQGHARALLAAAVEEAQGQGFSVMSLHVEREDPAATTLYRSSGFTEDSDEQVGGFFCHARARQSRLTHADEQGPDKIKKKPCYKFQCPTPSGGYNWRLSASPPSYGRGPAASPAAIPCPGSSRGGASLAAPRFSAPPGQRAPAALPLGQSSSEWNQDPRCTRLRQE